MSELQPVITKAGLSAVWRKDKTGLAAQITHVVIGTEGYTPANTQTALRKQVAVYPISDGETLSSTLLHVTAVADGPQAIWVREIGYLLSDGTLFAVWSHPTDVLAYKPAENKLLLAYDLSLTALPPDSVTITSTGAGLNLTLSEELAALATASIADILRGLEQQDVVESQAKLHQLEGGQIANLMERMRKAEARQDSEYAGFTELAAAQASASIADMLRGVTQQDAIEAQAKQRDVADRQIASLTNRVRQTEVRQAGDYEGLLTAIAVNAMAVVSLQHQITKATYGV
ncbi:phage tail protein [Pseudomonas sp. BC115LW]|uniref:phage tail-collar fiber domain-containing protein n=1 Tax=Pseudomonas sp. BC115LW TaxID=2683267 RepID=UPI001411FBC1|nr:phage tail protein [Pseudomonas sp. BC115LW]NBB33786.1 phage tail protein [Pseudomonas sp. BC115LW]